MSNKIVLVFGIIIGVALLSYVLHCWELNPGFNVKNLRSEDITSMKIYDRGIWGNDSLVIGNTEKLQELSDLIISSNKVEFNRINTKANQGLCEITLEMTNKENLTVKLIKSSFSEGLLSSGHYYHRNDSLLHVISKTLRHNARSTIKPR